MPRDGSGNYIRPAGQPVSSGTVIDAGVFNTLTTDIATALTGSMPRDGQAPPLQDLPMGGFKLTGLASGSAAADSVTLGQAQGAAAQWLTSVSGTNTITASASPAIAAYAAGQTFRFVPANTNTGAVTIQINAVGVAQSVTKNGSSPLTAGDLIAGRVYRIIHDGTRFQIDAQAVTLISSGSVSAVADIQFINLTAGFEAYQLVLHDLLPVTNNVDLHIQTSTNNGSTWQSGGSDYRHIRTASSVTGTPTATGSNADTKIVIANGLGNNAGSGNEFRGSILVHAPMDSSDQTAFSHASGAHPSGAFYSHWVGSGARTLSESNNAFRLVLSSGNIATCTYAFYGLKS